MAGIVLREQSDAGGLFYLHKITPRHKNALRTGFDFLMVRTLLHVVITGKIYCHVFLL